MAKGKRRASCPNIRFPVSGIPLRIWDSTDESAAKEGKALGDRGIRQTRPTIPEKSEGHKAEFASSKGGRRSRSRLVA